MKEIKLEFPTVEPITHALHSVSSAYETAKKEKNPLVIRRAYDISASCCRKKAKDSDATAAMHLRGECETPLLRCIVIGLAAAGGIYAVCALSKMCMAAKYRRRYAQQYKQQYKQQYAKQFADLKRADQLRMQKYRIKAEASEKTDKKRKPDAVCETTLHS
ncbi:MAG: hypothetical protein J6I50_08840 [Clostridia bacterium]|nr:hypothetical protein [Clostridia bacterium]